MISNNSSLKQAITTDATTTVTNLPSQKRRKVIRKTNIAAPKTAKKKNQVAGGRVDLENNYNSYDDKDDLLNVISPFDPQRQPGSQLNRHQLRTKTKAIDYFNLFFDETVIDKIVKHTNEYGYVTILNKSTYANLDGAWAETNRAEIRALIALLIYQGLVRVSSAKDYWSTKSLYHGLWVRKMLSSL